MTKELKWPVEIKIICEDVATLSNLTDIIQAAIAESEYGEIPIPNIAGKYGKKYIRRVSEGRSRVVITAKAKPALQKMLDPVVKGLSVRESQIKTVLSLENVGEIENCSSEMVDEVLCDSFKRTKALLTAIRASDAYLAAKMEKELSKDTQSA